MPCNSDIKNILAKLLDENLLEQNTIKMENSKVLINFFFCADILCKAIIGGIGTQTKDPDA